MTFTPMMTDTTERRTALVAAIQRAFDMETEDAEAVGGVVADLFSQTAEVSDDTIDAETRSVLYTLEAKKLLAFRREELSWETGEKRRAFYWRVRDEELMRLLTPAEVAEEMSVYDTLPADAWARHAS